MDRLIARTSLAKGEENGLLLSFLFHNLYKTEETPLVGFANPEEGVTIEMFRRFVDHFQSSGFSFVSPADIAKGLRPGGKYVLLTFDDGYHNNLRALPVLEEFKVPAVLFVSTGYVKEGRTFWWIVAEREALKRKTPLKAVRQWVHDLKKLPRSLVEAEIARRFGRGPLQQADDLHRPLTPSELRDIAGHRLVSIGNHTSDHVSLTNYSSADALALIRQGQDDIFAMTGKTAEMIAYPNGDLSAEIVAAAKSVGLRFGVGVSPGRNVLPLAPGSLKAMTLKRFTLTGNTAIEPQCHLSRSRVSLYHSARSVRVKASEGLSLLRTA